MRGGRRGGVRGRAAAVAAAALPLMVCGALAGAVVASCSADRHPEVPSLSPPAPGPVPPPIDIEAPGRTAAQLEAWASGVGRGLGISTEAIEAYGYAQEVMAVSRPACHLGWTTLAGIGSVESRHGTYGGASVDAGGDVAPHIRGVALDGAPGLEDIPDTDGGALDGDAVHDRAMGPMQFIPETWRHWGVDANGDGAADPDSIDDAALTAARYLCASGRDLSTAEGWGSALDAYNRSAVYAREVAFRANAYSVGVRP